MDDETKSTLAKKANLSSTMVDKVIDAWTNENYLEQVDDSVFFIGSRYPEAQIMLKEAGENQVLGSEAGKRQRLEKKKIFKKP